MPRTGKGPRTDFRRDRVRYSYRQIRYSYRVRGYCSYGSKSRFSHQEPVPPFSKNSSYHDPNNNVHVNNFLEEMKNVLNVLKGIAETQRQSTSLPFTNFQGFQHQQFILVTSQAQHVWPVTVMQ